mmetsp:Transcript_38832/g.42085  ORF Transcript_38832/g.42085 Transcript_38832/m.42085 type:complete len:113 (-) Transcript_38832:251-589(-)
MHNDNTTSKIASGSSTAASSTTATSAFGTSSSFGGGTTGCSPFSSTTAGKETSAVGVGDGGDGDGGTLHLVVSSKILELWRPPPIRYSYSSEQSEFVGYIIISSSATSGAWF